MERAGGRESRLCARPHQPDHFASSRERRPENRRRAKQLHPRSVSAKNCTGENQEEDLEERGKLSPGYSKITETSSNIINRTTNLRLRGRRGALLMLCAALLMSATPALATAQSHRHPTSHSKKRPHSGAGRHLYKAALLEDADSARILMATNADMIWPPAAMAKLVP